MRSMDDEEDIFEDPMGDPKYWREHPVRESDWATERAMRHLLTRENARLVRENSRLRNAIATFKELLKIW